MGKVVVFSGAGISAESGISTFRDTNGLWENHNIMEVASIEGWNNNPQLVLDFYNKRRAQLKLVAPNFAHFFFKELEKHFEVVIVTQNVDNLHERAGSNKVIHLHGELNMVRSVANSKQLFKWEDNLSIGDFAPDGYQLRPHIVWFGEDVPMMEIAIDEVSTADFFIIIGTSLQVYPAASLLDYVPKGTKIICIDPNDIPLKSGIIHIMSTAIEGVKSLKDLLF